MSVAMWMIEAERAELYGGKYAWVITRDRDAELGGGESCVGTAGPEGATDEQLQLARETGRQFRLVDEGDIDECGESGVSPDDPEYGVVYEGRIWIADGADDDDGEIEFMPLHDWGTPNYGCVGIQYRDDAGNWQDL